MHANDPVMRSRKLFNYFGWQGGTIHQVARETGVDVAELLYAQPTFTADADRNRFSQGCRAAETCGQAYRLTLVPAVKGNRAFWLGVACSIYLPNSPLCAG